MTTALFACLEVRDQLFDLTIIGVVENALL